MDDNTKLNRTIGRNIMNLRVNLGLTQEDVAQAVGTNYTTISRIENGRTSTTLRTLSRLAEVLKVSMAEILEVPNEEDVLTGNYRVRVYRDSPGEPKV